MLSQWKLFDNLRRSLVPAGLTLLFLVGWIVLPHAWLWTAVAMAVLLLPSACAFVLELFRKPDEVLAAQHFAAAVRVAGRQAAQITLALAFLPYEATVNLDAIARTMWRMLVSHRRLLEWNPSVSEHADGRRSDDTGRLAACLRSMWIAPVIATATAIALAASVPAALIVAAPILLLWFVSPAIAWWVSRPLDRREARLAAEQILFLRSLARRTWAFFETFVGPDDQWLPPDNQQEHPVAVVAHRTSPTNMGLSLLANLTAYDFGYLPAGELLLRTANAMGTMASLERHEGHFYNWYDTQSGKPLPPLYVSAVDSGNLAGAPADVAARPRGARRRQDLRSALVRRPERHVARPRGRHRRTAFRRHLRACNGISKPPTTRGPRPSRRRASGSIGSRRGWRRGGASTSRAPVDRTPDPGARGRTCCPPRSRRSGQRRSSANAGACRMSFAAARAMGDPAGCGRVRSSRAGIARNPDAARARGARRGPRCCRCRRAPGGNRPPDAALRCARPDGLRLSLRPGAPSALHRLQRRRAPAGLELLRPARLRSATRELRRDRAGSSCRRRTGSRSGASSRPPGASASSCPGAARCSST